MKEQMRLVRTNTFERTAAELAFDTLTSWGMVADVNKICGVNPAEAANNFSQNGLGDFATKYVMRFFLGIPIYLPLGEDLYLEPTKLEYFSKNLSSEEISQISYDGLKQALTNELQVFLSHTQPEIDKRKRKFLRKGV